MLSSQKFQKSNTALIFNYLPAQLKQYSCGWQIEYYVEDPITGEMIRVRNRVDLIKKRYSKKSEAIQHINKLIFDINLRLSKGWNPLTEGKENSRMFLSYSELSTKFMNEKNRELRPETLKTYKSYLNTFNSYIESHTNIKYLFKFHKLDAVTFIDYVYNERKVSSRSYNNYVKFFRLYFNWLKAHAYITTNYFDDIQLKKKEKKKRAIIPYDQRTNIADYMKEYDPLLLVVCKLMYFSLLRPKEISMLRVGDVSFSKKTIHVQDFVAKNHNERFATVPDILLQELKYIQDYPREYYLFSSDMNPGRKQADKDKFRKRFEKIKKQLKIPKEYQLYSYRDSGISDYIKEGLDLISIKQHADHHSLAMTDIYTDHFDPKLNEKIQNFVPKF
jgi:site-specific recombinase XerD